MKKLIMTLFIICLISVLFTLNCKVEASMLEEKVFTMTDEEHAEEQDDDIADHIMVYDAITGETKKANIEMTTSKTKSVESIEGYSPKKAYTSNIFNAINDLMSGRATNYLIKIPNPKEQPYCKTLKVRGYDSKGARFHGTAALIGPKIALTAAHCIWDDTNNDYTFRNWMCWPGYDMNTCLAAGAGWTRVFFDERWKTTHRREYDWAIVVLEKDYSNVVGWYGVNRYEDYKLLETQPVTLLGFPGVPPKNEPTDEWPYDTMYGSNGTVLQANEVNYLHSAATAGGMSGGPIIEKATGKILGIHIGKQEGSSYPLAVRITTQIINSAREALKY